MRSLDVPPSFIVDSGGGLQPIWLFDAPTTDFELVEGINRSLVALFDADPGTFNIDRLLRVAESIMEVDREADAQIGLFFNHAGLPYLTINASIFCLHFTAC